MNQQQTTIIVNTSTYRENYVHDNDNNYNNFLLMDYDTLIEFLNYADPRNDIKKFKPTTIKPEEEDDYIDKEGLAKIERIKTMMAKKKTLNKFK